MNIIGRYFLLSVKKNFTYKGNGPLVILDECMDCLSLWLFWTSLMALDLQLTGWGRQSLGLFMGFSLMSSAVGNLFVGSWDIQYHVQKGTLDNYLVKPCNPVLLILLERANFLRFVVTFPAGIILAAVYTPWDQAGTLIAGIGLCVLASVLLQLLVLSIYELAFWLKKVDTYADIAFTLLSIQQYPLIFFGRKLTAVFTYIVPVAFVGTIPAELIAGGGTGWSLGAFALLSAAIAALTWGLWQGGRRQYESAN